MNSTTKRPYYQSPTCPQYARSYEYQLYLARQNAKKVKKLEARIRELESHEATR